MAIQRHNRTIWVLALVIFLLLVTFLVREGKLENVFNQTTSAGPVSTEATSNSGHAVEDQFGDKVNSIAVGEVPPGLDSQKRFAQVIQKSIECLQYKNVSVPQALPVQIESLIQTLQSESGPISQQSDQSMSWNLKTREGHERRLQIQITESDEGKVGRELHYFSVSHDGRMMPIEIDSEKANNPSDEVINQLLKDGEVTYKERAAFAIFSNGDRIEYIEKNNELAEILVTRSEHQFRCSDALNSNSCQCQ